MPEIKNTFLKSKMNKDLDSRIIPNGEYRDGQNISISTSEGADVGALENIRGNINIASFGLNEPDLEIIGYYSDTANNRVFLFITNNNENIIDKAPKIINNGSSTFLNSTLIKNPISNYILYFSVDKNGRVNNQDTLVGGSFLNFSKNYPIYNVNVIENLLFWTDNRNQPRKINVDNAIVSPYRGESNPGYYYNEDHISVAKYAPYNSISFLKYLDNENLDKSEKTLKNEFDEFLPPFIAFPAIIKEFDGRQYVGVNGFPSNPGPSATRTEFTELRNFLTRFSSGEERGEFSPFIFDFSGQRDTSEPNPEDKNYKVKVSIYDEKNSKEAYIDYVSSNHNIYLQSSSGLQIFDFSSDGTPLLGWGEIDDKINISLSLRNPDFNPEFKDIGDEDLLKQKFVRFSYRFKFDDNEYSLTAPFSQHAFVPKQFGYFIGEDADRAKQSSIVGFMENQITTAGLVIDLPCASDEMISKLKVKELQLLYKASDEQAIKVITDIDLSNQFSIKGVPKSVSLFEDLNTSNPNTYTATPPLNIYKTEASSGSGLTIKVDTLDSNGNILTASVSYSSYGYKKGDKVKVLSGGNPANDQYVIIDSLTNVYIHDYRSQKPIKVLPEKEIVRVSDIVPIKAKTQEAVGNRIIYGNFQQTSDSLKSLQYNAFFSSKSINNKPYSSIEFNNHTLKQGRSYQVGIVLQDRYGRSSNVILPDDTNGFKSTFFAPYTNGGIDPISWPGNSIFLQFPQPNNETIPKESNGDYYGVWSDSNPMGWYSYKVVVKQQEQDYYNIYTPGAVSGNITFTNWKTKLQYDKINSISNIALFNDNINKIPRDLNEVGPSDRVYSSSVELINRVSQTERDANYANLNGQSSNYDTQDITGISTFRDIGDWTIYKGVDLSLATIGPAAQNLPMIKDSGSDVSITDISKSRYYNSTGGLDSFFIYPGASGQIDPFFLDSNKNPIIATIEVGKRIGLSKQEQENNNFSKELTIFETKPIKSNLDIYYETSTSGKIEDLNNDISTTTSTTGVASNLSQIDFSGGLFERSDYPATVSNQFTIIDSSGLQINDPTATISLDLVEYNSGGSSFAIMPPATTALSQNTPTFLTSNGFKSGDFGASDNTNPFSLSIALPSTSSSPAVYEIVTKRPITNLGIEDLIFRFSFTIIQGTTTTSITKTVSLVNIKPSIPVIGVPGFARWTGGIPGVNDSGDIYDGSVYDNRTTGQASFGYNIGESGYRKDDYTPARSVYIDWNYPTDKIRSDEYKQAFPGLPDSEYYHWHRRNRNWVDYSFVNGNYVKSNTSGNPTVNENWDCPAVHITGSKSTPGNSTFEGFRVGCYDFEAFACVGFYNPVPNKADGGANYKTKLNTPSRATIESSTNLSSPAKICNYFCEIPFSSNGLEVINKNLVIPYHVKNETGKIDGYVVNPNLHQTDYEIRHASTQDLDSNGDEKYPKWTDGSFNDPTAQPKNTRLQNLTYKVKRGYVQPFYEYRKRQYVRQIQPLFQDSQTKFGTVIPSGKDSSGNQRTAVVVGKFGTQLDTGLALDNGTIGFEYVLNDSANVPPSWNDLRDSTLVSDSPATFRTKATTTAGAAGLGKLKARNAPNDVEIALGLYNTYSSPPSPPLSSFVLGYNNNIAAKGFIIATVAPLLVTLEIVAVDSTLPANIQESDPYRIKFVLTQHSGD